MGNDAEEGRRLLAAGDRHGARRVLMAAIRSNPKDGELWWVLADALDDPAQAEDSKRRARNAGYTPPAAPVDSGPGGSALLRRLQSAESSAPPPPAVAAVSPPAAAPPSFPQPLMQAIPVNQCPRCRGGTPATSRFCNFCGWDYAAPPGMVPGVAFAGPPPSAGKSNRLRNVLLGIIGLMFVSWCAMAQVRGGSQGIGSSGSAGNLGTVEMDVYTACTAAVKQRLKAPSTAKISSFGESSMIKDPQKNLWLAAGTVDAENAFGARLRQEWLCEARGSGGRIVVDGVEFIER